MSTANSKGASSANAERVPAPPLVNLDNSWLNQVSSRIRSRPIPWEGYQRADLVSSEELQMIRSVDSATTLGGAPSSSSSSSSASATAVERAKKLDSLFDGADNASGNDKDGDDAKGKRYAKLFLGLLAKLSRTDTLQQILVFVADMLNERDDRAELFLDAAAGEGADGGDDDDKAWPWAPLIKLLDSSDDFVSLSSAHLLTLFLLSAANRQASNPGSPSKIPSAATSHLLSFLTSLLNSGYPRGNLGPGVGALAPPPAVDGFAEGNGATLALQLLEGLLRSAKFRKEVWREDVRRMSEVADHGEEGGKKDGSSSGAGIIRGLVSILRASLAGGAANANGAPSGSSTPASGGGNGGGPVGPQMQYQVIFCLWLLSFDAEIAAEINGKFGIVPVLGDVARGAVKEKVVRIVSSVFRNLVVVPSASAIQANASAMLGAKLLPLAESLSARKWSDEEIEEDLDEVKKVLGERLKGMSTYDEYLSELSSGNLTWENPAHVLEEFWKANAPRMTSESNGEGLELLVSVLLQNPSEVNVKPETLAVACHDVGKLVQYNEGAKRKLEEKGAKSRILQLIQHEDKDVQFRALGTVSRLVSGSWRS